MTTPKPIKSTSPDSFLRRNQLMGADASTRKVGDQPLKSTGTLDTLYQPKETTTADTPVEDPRQPKDND